MKEVNYIEICKEYEDILKPWKEFHSYEDIHPRLGKVVVFLFNVGDRNYINFMQFITKEKINFDIRRRQFKFTKKEKEAAEILQLHVYEYAKDSYLTEEISRCCNACGQTLPTQLGKLHVNYNNIKKYDLCSTYPKNSEVIVSERLKHIFESENIEGVDYLPIYQMGKKDKVIDGYYRLKLNVGIGEIVSPSLVECGEKCEECGFNEKFLLKGLLFFNKDTWSGAPICYSKNYFGQPVSWQKPIIIISSKMHKILIDKGIKSFLATPLHFI